MDTILHKQGLTAEQLAMVQSEVMKNQKSKGIAFALWFFLGVFGAHRFYLGDTGYAVAMLLLGWMTFGIWWIIDAFLISGRIDRDTLQVELKAIEKVKLYANAKKEEEKEEVTV